MSTVDKLNKVLETKEAIKQALIDKGQDVGDVFAEYPNAIQSIEGGGRFVVPKEMRFGYSTVREFPEDWDWSEWKNEGTLSSAFYACNNLIKAPKLSIHPAVVSHMFNGCGSLKSVDMSDWITESIFAASGLFDGCRSLETLDLSNWDTSSLTQMNEMFDGCSSLKSINFGTFNTDKVTDYSSTFYGCSSLKKLPEFNAINWNPSYVSAYNSPLNQCYSLRDFGGFLNLHTTFYANSANSLSYESIMNIINKLADGVSGQTLYLTQDCVNMLSDEDIAIATNKGWTISPAKTIFEPIVVTNLSQVPSGTQTITPRTYDFSQYSGELSMVCTSSITSFEANISNTTSCQSMFYGAKQYLAYVDLSGTSKVTDMLRMFYNCPKLMDVKIEDVSNVTDMNNMFYKCTNLSNVNFTDWNVSNVTDFQEMFYQAGNYDYSLDLSNWNFKEGALLEGMFKQSKFKDITLGDTSNVLRMGSMFSSCEAESITMTTGCANGASMQWMFHTCQNIKSIKMLGDMSGADDVSMMFYGVTTEGTFYYNPAYDYSKIIAELPESWTAVPLTE